MFRARECPGRGEKSGEPPVATQGRALSISVTQPVSLGLAHRAGQLWSGRETKPPTRFEPQRLCFWRCRLRSEWSPRRGPYFLSSQNWAANLLGLRQLVAWGTNAVCEASACLAECGKTQLKSCLPMVESCLCCHSPPARLTCRREDARHGRTTPGVSIKSLHVVCYHKKLLAPTVYVLASLSLACGKGG